jgi:hypothetical protein
MRQYIPLLTELLKLLNSLYTEYKKWEREQAVEKIKANPSVEWNKRFGHVDNKTEGGNNE